MGPLGGALPSGTGSGSFREPRALPLPSAAWDPLRSLRPGRGPSPTPRAPRSQPSGLQNREVCKSPGPPWFLRRPEDTKTGREQGRLRDTPRSRRGEAGATYPGSRTRTNVRRARNVTTSSSERPLGSRCCASEVSRGSAEQRLRAQRGSLEPPQPAAAGPTGAGFPPRPGVGRDSGADSSRPPRPPLSGRPAPPRPPRGGRGSERPAIASAETPRAEQAPARIRGMEQTDPTSW